MKENTAKPRTADAVQSPSTAPAPRVVYTQAPVLLGTLLGRGTAGWRIRVGTVESEVAADASIDVALLEEAAATGGRVVVDSTGEPIIAGLLVTHRAVRISPEGSVDAKVTDFRVTARNEVLLRASDAFVQAKAGEVELYGNRVLVRARELAKMLGRMIKLN